MSQIYFENIIGHTSIYQFVNKFSINFVLTSFCQRKIENTADILHFTDIFSLREVFVAIFQSQLKALEKS